MTTPIHLAFGLSYAGYLVVPRHALQEMPIDWQERFCALMDEAYRDHGMADPGGYIVSRRIAGRFVRDPWRDYRRGSVAAARAADERLGVS